ncbi:MAG: hypothetical protein MR639_00950 [Clostridium sp.]|uniref:hypothetical protein n=1 Tax=Clostridium sp. TaxID=1506 RepID=UPI002A86F97D|nr:hypothetical protein [Clostridium sp.]MDY5096840.1 hypothetical protein [Clostridium sp.]
MYENFSQSELEQVESALDLMEHKVNIGYKNSIIQNTLPGELVSNKDEYDFFVKSVNDFNKIKYDLTQNRPDLLTNDQWNEITCLCLSFIEDARKMGGVARNFEITVNYVLNEIFQKKRMELGCTEPPKFISNSVNFNKRKKKIPILFGIGSILNIMMIPLFFYNFYIAIIFGVVGYTISKISGCSFDDIKK